MKDIKEIEEVKTAADEYLKTLGGGGNDTAVAAAGNIYANGNYDGSALTDARKDFKVARDNYIAAKSAYIAAHNALYRVTKK